MTVTDQEKIRQGLKLFENRGKSRGRVYLGYGRQDKFAGSCDLLAAALPPEQVFTGTGGHDWPTWKLLWARILPELSRAMRQPVIGTP